MSYSSLIGAPSKERVFLDKERYEFIVRYSTDEECWLLINLTSKAEQPIKWTDVKDLYSNEFLWEVTQLFLNQELQWLFDIKQMSHEEMARMARFQSAGETPIFSNGAIYAVWNDRFLSFGGMTSDISKKIGLGQ